MDLPEGHPDVHHPMRMMPTIIYVRQNGKWVVTLIVAFAVIIFFILRRR